MRKKLLGYYNYTVVLTYVGMICGFTGIVFAMEEKINASLLFLMIAGVCDMFDGAIASTKKRCQMEKNFGIQIDSLSDLVCFGLLPGVLVIQMNGQEIIAIVIASLYILCTLIRLAYFNVDEQERQLTSTQSRIYYFGLPVTVSALSIPMMYKISELLKWNIGAVCIGVLVISGICNLLTFKLHKPKVVGKLLLILLGAVELVLFIIAGDKIL